MVLMSEVLMLLVSDEAAAADVVELGPDGYFSTMNAGDKPVITDGWENTPRIMFGKADASVTYGNLALSGGYKTLAKGLLTSVLGEPYKSLSLSQNALYTKSNTTRVNADEVLLWSDDVVTGWTKFDAVNSPVVNAFDSATNAYQSNLAQVSVSVGAANYSAFEQSLLREDRVEGVCIRATGCGTGTYVVLQQNSVNKYRVFPLTSGDMQIYLNHTSGGGDDAGVACPFDISANDHICGNDPTIQAYWLRSARWDLATNAHRVSRKGGVSAQTTSYQSIGLRPAFRLKLENLLLTANSGDQSQSEGDLRLTFVDRDKTLMGWSASVVGGAGSRRLNLSGVSDLDTHSGLGWKLVDPDTNDVLGSGRTSTGGNVALPESKMTDVSKEYELYLWGQQDGNAIDGLTNRATEVVKMEIVDWKVKQPPVAFGIDLSGETEGALNAYRIGEYSEIIFDHTGAVKSLQLITPDDPVKSTVLSAAVEAGGSSVDSSNPLAWVATHWLGYPTDPPSEDVTSAYGLYAGNLQLFAQALTERLLQGDDDVLGEVKGSLPSGTFSSGGMRNMVVSGPGLYLIVDSTGESLPVIVGTKILNENLPGGQRLVDFVDAGVRGKPQLGMAGLKTNHLELSKRVINDAGMDGFDVGSEVEFEIAFKVPDLRPFSSVSFDDYTCSLTDTAAEGLTMPDKSEVHVFMDTPVANTEVVDELTLNVSGQTLTVNGLKLLFAQPESGGTSYKVGVSAGSLIRVRYVAVLGLNGDYSAPGGGNLAANVNSVKLERSTSDGGTEQIVASVGVYSFQTNLMKVDKDQPTQSLAGAGFEVIRDGEVLRFVHIDAGVYRLSVPTDATTVSTVVSHADGSLLIQGMEAREFSLKEVDAPADYFRVPVFSVEISPVWNADGSEIILLSYRTAATNFAYVSQDGWTVLVADPAYSLANLPNTGGIGLILLLVAVGLFAAFAVYPYYCAHRAEVTANILE
jgi:fimbrial isopeptide formation D2 family protein